MSEEKVYQEKARELPVYDSFDVVVCGGGVAGTVSAIAAARNGAKTLIIERFPFFGGTATASLMANLNGFRNQVEPDDLQTTKGIGEEIMLEMIELGGASRSCMPSKQYPGTPGHLTYSYAIDPEIFKYLLLKMITDAGAHILFHTWIADVIKTDESVSGVIVENKSGRMGIFGKVVVDATGDGDIAYRAGAPYWQIRRNEDKRLDDNLMYKVSTGKMFEGWNCCTCNGSSVIWGPYVRQCNCADADELTQAEITTRLKVFEDFEMRRKEHMDIYGDAHIIETASLIGIRQTRLFEGDYKLTAEDVINKTHFDDAVGMASSPIIAYYGHRHFLKHTGYQLPYRMMLPKGVENLLVCGRCMSSDQQAFESFRAMGSIFPMGEACGTAAALASLSGVTPRELNVKMLQCQLLKQGAELGEV